MDYNNCAIVNALLHKHWTQMFSCTPLLGYGNFVLTLSSCSIHLWWAITLHTEHFFRGPDFYKKYKKNIQANHWLMFIICYKSPVFDQYHTIMSPWKVHKLHNFKTKRGLKIKQKNRNNTAIQLDAFPFHCEIF